MCKWVSFITHSIPDADHSFRLNPDVIKRMAQMTPEARRHLRKVARERDSSHADTTFRLAQADTDITEATEKRKAAEKSKKKATERRESLEAFKPTLDLKQLQEDGCKGYKVKEIKRQIVWHRQIGEDAHIPTGVHGMQKEEVWPVMIRAVRRHLRGTSADEGRVYMISEGMRH
jgi:predicted transcriptional regulator